MAGARWALVTGASRGIGLAIARTLASEGMEVALLARNRDDLERAAADIERAGGIAYVAAADIGDVPAVISVVRELVERNGAPPDVIVNNAGRFALAAAHEVTVGDFAATVTTNLVGPFAVVRAVLPSMRERAHGHIVTIGSIADRSTFPENGAYAASKYGLRALHEVLRAELRGSGVRTTLVSPGPVDTPLWDEVDPDTRPGFTPRAQMLSSDAVAEAVRWVVTRPTSVNVDELRISRS